MKHQVAPLRLPGGSVFAYAMLPLRLVVWTVLFSILFPLLLLMGTLRAIYLRLRVGLPSQILVKGTRGNTNDPDVHYPCIHLFTKPIDEPKMRAALVSLCAENNIQEKDLLLEFGDEAPLDWPDSAGNWPADYWIKSLEGKLTQVGYAFQKSGKKFKMKIFNAAEADMPTVVWFCGSANGWDGSANFNFAKELYSRYAGNVRNAVFQAPNISPAAAAKFDNSFNFLWFLTKMPYHVGQNIGGLLWTTIKAAKWAGGNGLEVTIQAMNFNEADSARLYHGAKALGASPFACFTYAATKACAAVLQEAPTAIIQQASLQSRHFPLVGSADTRDLVGDWLIGPTQFPGPPDLYDLPAAQRAYKELITELDDIGPAVQKAFHAKAYGLLNAGAGGFEIFPVYNDASHVMDRCIFMNNYGTRSVDAASGFATHNWNAPLWFGLNTINVNGATCTMVGSSVFGMPVVEAMRDHIEATLREIMTHAPPGAVGVGQFAGSQQSPVLSVV